MLKNGSTRKICQDLQVDFAALLCQEIRYKLGKDGLVCELKNVEQ